MDPRLLDVLIGVVCFLIFAALLVGLPYVLAAGLAYLVAIVLFIAVMACVGYIVREKIVG